MKNNPWKFLVLGLLILASLSACAEPQPAGLSADQVGAVVENILTSIDANDYQGFSRDFSDAMLSAFTEDSFAEMRTMLQDASGSYVSLGELTLVNQQGYAIYLYQCEYEKENVIVKVVFEIGGAKVDGLFFDSTNLRAASK